ncbi:MAG: hypothetical protein AUH32_02790 [Actinobacteria bacterium 13_1_40CM_66_12]|nr:MAG: hypothetical protein AUH32_02790 [Actinobacteria bacterium 13_1_40CM_66_12]
MQDIRLSRRDVLKAAGALGGLAIAIPWLGPIVVAADEGPFDEPMGPFGPWSPPAPIEELASTHGDFHPGISKDGLSLFFTTDRSAPPLTEIWVSRRASLDSQWGSPDSVDSLNSAGATTGVPNLAPSRHFIYFNSDRLGNGRPGDLYFAFRKDKGDDFGWQAPALVPGQLNTAVAAEAGPTYFEDEAGHPRLYFTRFAGKGVFGQPDQDFDIHVSFQNADGSFGPGQIVPALNAIPQAGDPPHTWSRDTRTAIRRDGLEMYITSNRHGGLTYSGLPMENLWVSTRADTSTEDWSVPELVEGLNSGFGDGGPALSWDGTTLYFFSQRTASGQQGKRQLWTSSRDRQ